MKKINSAFPLSIFQSMKYEMAFAKKKKVKIVKLFYATFWLLMVYVTFDLRLLIIPLVSSYFSFSSFTSILWQTDLLGEESLVTSIWQMKLTTLRSYLETLTPKVNFFKGLYILNSVCAFCLCWLMHTVHPQKNVYFIQFWR